MKRFIKIAVVVFFSLAMVFLVSCAGQKQAVKEEVKAPAVEEEVAKEPEEVVKKKAVAKVPEKKPEEKSVAEVKKEEFEEWDLVYLKIYGEETKDIEGATENIKTTIYYYPVSYLTGEPEDIHSQVKLRIKENNASLNVKGYGVLLEGNYTMDEDGMIEFHPTYGWEPALEFAEPVISDILMEEVWYLQASMEEGYGVLRAENENFSVVAKFHKECK